MGSYSFCAIRDLELLSLCHVTQPGQGIISLALAAAMDQLCVMWSGGVSCEESLLQSRSVEKDAFLTLTTEAKIHNGGLPLPSGPFVV